MIGNKVYAFSANGEMHIGKIIKASSLDVAVKEESSGEVYWYFKYQLIFDKDL